MDKYKIKQSVLLTVLPNGANLILEYTDSIYSEKDIDKLKRDIKQMLSEENKTVLQKLPTVQEMITKLRS